MFSFFELHLFLSFLFLDTFILQVLFQQSIKLLFAFDNLSISFLLFIQSLMNFSQRL